MKHLFILSLTALSLFSCSNNKPEYDASLGPVKNMEVKPIPVNNLPAANQNVVVQPTTAPVSQTISAASAVTSQAGINPAHGEPGHRCDIAVGAPLNSPVQKSQMNVAPMVSPLTASAATQNAPAVTTAPGMNPPHGRPGHRCEIAVGAPLNSPAPAKASPAISPVAVPAQPAPATNVQATPPAEKAALPQ